MCEPSTTWAPIVYVFIKIRNRFISFSFSLIHDLDTLSIVQTQRRIFVARLNLWIRYLFGYQSTQWKVPTTIYWANLDSRFKEKRLTVTVTSFLIGRNHRSVTAITGSCYFTYCIVLNTTRNRGVFMCAGFFFTQCLINAHLSSDERCSNNLWVHVGPHLCSATQLLIRYGP